jgi:hypothetical protein
MSKLKLLIWLGLAVGAAMAMAATRLELNPTAGSKRSAHDPTA